MEETCRGADAVCARTLPDDPAARTNAAIHATAAAAVSRIVRLPAIAQSSVEPVPEEIHHQLRMAIAALVDGELNADCNDSPATSSFAASTSNMGDHERPNRCCMNVLPTAIRQKASFSARSVN